MIFFTLCHRGRVSRLMSEKEFCSYDSVRNIFSACISRLYDITRWIYQAVQMGVAIEVVVLGGEK